MTIQPSRSALDRESTPFRPDLDSERLLHTAVEASPGGILVVDRRGTILLVNHETERIFGYTRDELVGRTMEVLIPRRARVEHLEHRAAFHREPQPRALGMGRDLYGIRKDGTEIPLEIGLKPFETTDGLLIVASVIDIRARLQTDARLRIAVEASPSGMVMVDPAGTIVLVNREVERLFGYGRGELIGQPLETLVPDETRTEHPSLREAFARKARSRAMGEGRDLYGRHKNGAHVPVEIGLNPIRMQDGVYVLASVVDISERKKAEEELRRSNQELERFAYVASHDLQEPLRTVSNYVQLLARRYGDRLDDDATDFIGYAVDGADRMRHLIDDLLALSRVGTHGRPLQATDLQAVAANAVANLDAAIRESGTTVALDALPRVMGDAIQLEHVFTNLLGNAIKFRSDADPLIRVTARRVGAEWTVTVQDNGIGIAPEFHDRVFVIFQRLHRQSEYEGTGIGLALCQKIIERHGGRIWVDSTPGRGAAFHFTLPAAQES